MIDNCLNRAVRLAKQASMCSDYRKYPMGSVIFYKKNILSVGYNSYKGNPLQGKYNKYRATPDCDEYLLYGSHAEMNALRNLLKSDPNIDFSKVSIFIYRETKSGKYAMARPCKSCMKAIQEFGIKNIYYTGDKTIVHEEVV